MIAGVNETHFDRANAGRVVENKEERFSMLSRLLTPRNFLLAFACLFPLVAGRDRLENNSLKFDVLAVSSLILGGVIFRRFRFDLFSLFRNRNTRLPMILGAVFGIYAIWLLNFTPGSFLIIFLFFITVPILVQGYLKDKLRKHVITLVKLLSVVVVICCYFNANQSVALAGGALLKTGLITYGCCLLIFIATILFIPMRGAFSPSNPGIPFSNRLFSDAQSMLEMPIKWMLAGSFVVSIIGLLQFFEGNFMARIFSDLQTDPRSIGTLGQPNWFGTYLLLMLPLSTYQFFRERSHANGTVRLPFWSRPRFAWGLLCCLLYANILTAQTRGAWIATAVFIAFLFVSRPEHRRNTAKLTALFFVVTALLAPWNNWAILKRADTLPTEAGHAVEGSSSTGSGRFGFWKYALRMLPRHAILGSGLDTLGKIAPPGTTPVLKAHSIYLEYAVTIGIPGLLFYLAFIWGCTEKASRSFLRWTLRAVIVVYFVQGIFIHDKIQTWPLLWFIAGLSALASNEAVKIPESGMAKTVHALS
ncbi:MAG TPA: O-antigen ligase family protein [Verrucomicrobiae bacterium]|nr:O-antigen ligase family protein [Verrucomicrobiae bacterium]